VTWARGQLSTPYGPLTVRWQVGEKRGAPSFTLRITAPTGTSGQVAVPVDSVTAKVRVDGRVVLSRAGAEPTAYNARFVGGYAILDGIGAGQHTITLE
jgi:hypothetical protein